MADIAGKTFSQLTPISKASDTAKLAVDNGGAECNSLALSNLRTQLFDYYRAQELLTLDNLNATLGSRMSNCILAAPNGVGFYSGVTLTVKAGLKVSIPNGRNADGTLNNIVYTLPNDITRDFTWSYQNGQVVFLNNTGVIYSTGDIRNYYESDIEPRKQTHTVWWDTKNNLIKSITDDVTADWSVAKYAKIGYIYGSGSGITKWVDCYPAIVMTQDLNGQAPYIREFRLLGENTWYRVWSNGCKEQYLLTPLLPDYAKYVITFPIPFAGTNYTISYANFMNGDGDDTSYNNAAVFNLATKTTTGIQICTRGATLGGRYFTIYVAGF